MMNELSLFSGYGGFSLGLQLYFGREHVRTIGYCEIEPYCQEILKARIRDGYLDDAPIFPDIRALDGKQYRGLVDIITAGFPCQPHSVAGKRAGALDDRNLWPDTIRVIDEVGPAIVLLENVPGILANGYAGTVVGQLAERGYDAIWGLLSASSVGAPHVRTRWWCLAYANRYRAAQSGWRGDCLSAFLGEIQERRNQTDSQDQGCDTDYGSESLAYTESKLSDKRNGGEGEVTLVTAPPRRLCSSAFPPPPDDGEAWREVLENDCRLEPSIRGVAYGPPHRVDRLKALGNGIVPVVATEFLRRVARIETIRFKERP